MRKLLAPLCLIAPAQALRKKEVVRHIALAVLNSLAPEFGFGPATPDEIARRKLPQARELLTKRIGIPLWNVRKLRRLERRWREEIVKHCNDPRIFAGMPELFNSLHREGYRLGVVTSNSASIVSETLARYGAQADFIHAGSRYFGKRRALKEVLREQKIDRGQTFYVGDELRDVEACKKVGIDMLAVGWGFNAPETLRAAGARVATTPQELSMMLTAA